MSECILWMLLDFQEKYERMNVFVWILLEFQGKKI
jgi:hypothetical protein